MHYALNPRTFLFSHYFYTGLRVAIGVIGLTFLALTQTSLPTAMTVSIGALCASLMDLPGPPRHKFNGMLASVLLCSAVTLIISLCTPVQWLLDAMLVLVSFLASMMVVFGRKSMPLQFAALFIMTLSMMAELDLRQSLIHTALFMAGGLGYLCYAMAVAWVLRRRMKQQVLAEALFELARYVRIKARFYDMHASLPDQFHQLARQQVVLADKQQDARDLILRDWQREPDPLLMQAHFGMLDVYELVLSAHTDYVLLRRHFADAEVLDLLRVLADKAAADLEAIALAVTRDQPAGDAVDYRPELLAMGQALRQIEQMRPAGTAPDEALTVLRSSFNKIRETISMVARLRRATQLPSESLPLAPDADVSAFLTQQRYDVRVLLSHLTLHSPVFRFALRVAMAIATGLLVAHHLPYSSHGYWIVLTIAIVLKPSFSLTRRRRGDRLTGTLIGCLLAALILHFVHTPAALLGFLFLATAAVPTFLYIKYLYTAIAASVQILLQINLLIPGNSHVISERLLDTVIGVAIVSFFSFILPSWEYRGLPKLVKSVLRTNRRYLVASRELLQGRVAGDFPYRLARKRFIDSVAALGGALARMLDEPAGKQHAVEDIHLFIVQNYLIAAHIAALRLLWRRHAQDVPREAVNALLQRECDHVEATLESAERMLEQQLAGKNVEDAMPAGTETDVAPPDLAWSGWSLLLRRVGLLRQDADRIALRSQAIGRELGRAEG